MSKKSTVDYIMIDTR